MDDAKPKGPTLVESLLPHAVDGVLVDERYLAEEIDNLWVSRQTYHRAIQRQKSEMRSRDSILAEMLYTMQAVLLRSDRGAAWSEFLRDRRIPRAVADRLVVQYQRKLGQEHYLRGATHEATEADVRTLFSRVWLRLQKKLTTQESVYWFICNLALESCVAHELHNDGIFVFDSPSEALEETSTVVAAAPITIEAAAGAGSSNEVI